MQVKDMPRISDHDPALIPAAAKALVVAWNPLGTLLAVYTLAGTVDLYDCSNGHLLRSLSPAAAHPLSGSATLLSWSPDGQGLLLSSARSGLVTLWGNETLSHVASRSLPMNWTRRLE
jgi:WD40 repeat protein